MLKLKLMIMDLSWSDMSKYSEDLGVTSTYIDSFLNTECSNFLGVYSPDTLPQNLKSKGTLVCNLSNSNLIGSHFITIVVQPQSITYIDSYGVPSENPLINAFMQRLDRPIRYNSTMIQSLASAFCGFFCILFCLYFDKKRSTPLRFYADLAKNDVLCINLINTLRRNNKSQ